MQRYLLDNNINNILENANPYCKGIDPKRIEEIYKGARIYSSNELTITHSNFTYPNEIYAFLYALKQVKPTFSKLRINGAGLSEHIKSIMEIIGEWPKLATLELYIADAFQMRQFLDFLPSFKIDCLILGFNYFLEDYCFLGLNDAFKNHPSIKKLIMRGQETQNYNKFEFVSWKKMELSLDIILLVEENWKKLFKHYAEIDYEISLGEYTSNRILKHEKMCAYIKQLLISHPHFKLKIDSPPFELRFSSALPSCGEDLLAFIEKKARQRMMVTSFKAIDAQSRLEELLFILLQGQRLKKIPLPLEIVSFIFQCYVLGLSHDERNSLKPLENKLNKSIVNKENKKNKDKKISSGSVWSDFFNLVNSYVAHPPKEDKVSKEEHNENVQQAKEKLKLLKVFPLCYPWAFLEEDNFRNQIQEMSKHQIQILLFMLQNASQLPASQTLFILSPIVGKYDSMPRDVKKMINDFLLNLKEDEEPKQQVKKIM